MQPKHDAWYIKKDGSVVQIEVTWQGQGHYRCETCWEANLHEGDPGWGLDRETVYREAIQRAEAKANQLKREFVAACNFADRLIRDREQGR
jgi:hypothetical protein